MLTIASIIFLILLIFLSSFSKKNSRKRGRDGYKESLQQKFLKASEECEYSKQSLCNSSEKKLYWNLIKQLSPQYLVHTQVSLGEIVSCTTKTPDNIGYRAINSKRSDFLVTDKQFNPIAAVEFHGGGHYRANYQTRDQVKANVLRKAGIKYIVLSKTSNEHIQQVLTEQQLLTPVESTAPQT